MNILVWLLVGGLIGWAASVFMGTDGRQGIVLNVIVGIVGAALGGWLFSGSSTINQGNLSFSGLMVSLVGAVALIVLMKFVRGVASR
jgi:uncharacterized membrane protein YeaQ/YmgE (transglycosylase-associated protein family)